MIVDGMILCKYYSCYVLDCCANAVNVISANDPNIPMSIDTIVVANFVYYICVRRSFLLGHWANLLDSEVAAVEVMSMHHNCCTFAYYRISD